MVCGGIVQVLVLDLWRARAKTGRPFTDMSEALPMGHKAIYVQPGGGYHNVQVGTCEAAAPQAGEISVRLRANSLNYHDFAVVSGMWGPSAPRIPMADGAGEVVEVGSAIDDVRVGDHVVFQFSASCGRCPRGGREDPPHQSTPA